MKYIIILMASLSLLACQPHGHDGNHDHGDADHHDHGDHGHDHGTSSDIPRVDYTVWTDQTELFVEFPVFIVGEPSRFAAHFTVIDKHQAVKEGQVTVSLIKGSNGIRQTAEQPSSPGIFSPTLQPKEAGWYQLVFELKTPAYSDKIILDSIQVYATKEAAIQDNPEEEDGASISFLKEQAWKIDFQTEKVKRSDVYDVISTSGVWKEAPSNVKTLTATSSGIVSFTKSNLTVGSKVSKGQTLLTISSKGFTENNLSTEISKSKAEYDQAKAEYERKKKLHESKVVPKAEFEKVEQRYRIAKTNYESLSTGYNNGGKNITAPFNGFIKAINVSNGDFAEQGTPLSVITSQQSSLLEVSVSPDYATALTQIKDIKYQVSKGVWSNLNKYKGKVLSVSNAVSSNEPLLTIYAQVNEPVELPEGSFTKANVMFGKAQKAIAVPTSALLEDYGNYSVIVQLSGESFERRQITIGKSSGDEVEVLAGLAEEEVIVTTGAYQVKMASMSGQAPAHGHAH